MHEIDIAGLSAEQCAALLDRGELTAVELLEATLKCAETRNPKINAIVDLDPSGARQAAGESDIRRRNKQSLGPLDGIPVTVKDNLGARGMKATWGSTLLAEQRCDQDDLAVERLRRAGAVVWAKTNLPEFALAGVTDNPLFGATRNPWNLSLTPGGSSGGAAAALAAGLGPLALGTDAGGSARRPAAYTGTVGFRPSNGMVPRRSMFPSTTYDCQVIAPMARSVGDLALLFEALAGPDSSDRTSMLSELARTRAAGSNSGTRLRILYFPNVASKPIEPEITDAVARAAKLLEGLDHSVVEGPAPFDLEQIERVWSVLSAAGIASVATASSWPVTKLTPLIQSMIKRGSAIPATTYIETLSAIWDVRRNFDRLFEGFDALLCPTSPCFPWPLTKPYPTTIAGRGAAPRDAAAFLAFVNVAGIPAVSLPFAQSAEGLPIAIQLAAPFGSDLKLLALARQVEAARPPLPPWPAI